MEILNKSNDGFFIAGEDLKLRGPGDIFGIRQSGDMDFKLGDIYNDASILKAAAEAVKSLTDQAVKAIFELNPYLEEQILKQNQNTL